ncbi:MAG: hypothetical protein AAF753_02235 [Pseudomonadota bacterium]
MLGCRHIICGVLAALFWSGEALAQSFLDSDFYCRTYGCVIVHDGVTFDVYDNFIFAGGGTVPPGGEMIPWTGNPFQGSGTVDPVLTGTRDEGVHTVPGGGEGVLLGIDTDANGTIDLAPTTNQLGFLDASGVFQPFGLTGSARLLADLQTYERSFYLSSRTDFYVAAQARTLGAASQFSSPDRLSDIRFVYGITRSGSDSGMAFGQSARPGTYFSALPGIDSLGDVRGQPTFILEFRDSIRQAADPSLPRQSVRFDYAYGLEAYDLSMGFGDLRYQIEFTFYNR